MELIKSLFRCFKNFRQTEIYREYLNFMELQPQWLTKMFFICRVAQGETFGNNKVGCALGGFTNGITYVLKYLIFFVLQENHRRYRK